MPLIGGWSGPKPADEDVCMLTKWVKRKTDRRYKEFNAVEYRSQVVAGYNYVIKVQVGGNDYVHLMIFQSLVHDDKITIEFLGVRGGYKREDPLVPF
uniref:Leukocyte cysteine proteinase inhibitor 1-like n=1 Tax=Fundulus heteroclitus TaxID=8078 RepID=A0A3Q2PGE3_FUNHE